MSGRARELRYWLRAFAWLVAGNVAICVSVVLAVGLDWQGWGTAMILAGFAMIWRASQMAERGWR